MKTLNDKSVSPTSYLWVTQKGDACTPLYKPQHKQFYSVRHRREDAEENKA